MPDSDVGSYFGKYFLLKKLAAGGMGEVFLAKQQGPAGFEKVLVVKKILPHLTENKEFIELFLGEARLSARMNHRNIVQVFELGEESNVYFIAMEYVQGKPLRDILDRAKEKREKMPAEICRTVAEQICDGSSYAHNLTDVSGRCLNLVHRDLNPQNVLISYTGDVKIIDFGIAKSEMSTVKTEAGMIKGKFVYMSPEQSLAKKLDKRSDIFAIGITVYEMLTGINPFHKNNIVLSLEAVQRFDPPPPSEYDPSYAPFDPIIAKAMAKDRDRRYSDAAEMQDDLRRIVLPRANERLGQFISRLFRVELEAEQKVLLETDASRVSQSAKMGRTPARPAAARPASTTMPDNPPAVASRGQAQENNDGATMMLAQPTNQVQTGSRKVAATPARSVPAPRPPPRAPAPPPRPTANTNNDTMIDGESPLTADPALAAAVAKAKAEMQGDAGEGRTEFLGTGNRPQPPPPRKGPSAPPPKSKSPPPEENVGSTLQVGPEAAAAAKRDALAKAAASSHAKPAGPSVFANLTKNKKMMLIVGGAVALALIIVIFAVVALFSDGSEKEKKKARPRTAAVVESNDDSGDKAEKKEAKEKAADRAPEKAPEKAEQDTSRPPPDAEVKQKSKQQKQPKQEKVAAAKALGTLIVNAAGAPVAWDGGAPRAGAQRIAVTDKLGIVTVGDSGTPFKVELEYTVDGSTLVFKVRSTPWAIVSVDGPTRGKTPLADLRIEKKLTLVELKKPGQPNGMAIRLRYDGN